MNLNIDPEWLLRMAEKEGNGIISVGGLVTRLAPQTTKAASPVRLGEAASVIVERLRGRTAEQETER